MLKRNTQSTIQLDALVVWQLVGLKVTDSIEFEIPSKTGVLNYCANEKKITSILSQRMRSWVGKYDMLNLESGPILYMRIKIDNSDLDGAYNSASMLFTMVRNIIGCLWLIKDSAVDVERTYVEFLHNEGLVLKHTRSLMLALNTGHRSETNFSKNEVIAAFSEISQKFSALMLVNDTNIASQDLAVGHTMGAMGLVGGGGPRLISQNGIPRFARFWYFIWQGRGQSDVGLKVANWCTALESLFTTDASELVHKIAERIAFFLGKDANERITIFKDVKNAYSVRSKVVHGDILKGNRVAMASEASQKLDDYLRRIVKMIFENENYQKIFASNELGLASFFEELVLG